jgi:hypothetical protein
MTTEIQTVESKPRETNVLVVAEHPAELQAAQASLVGWADSRLAVLRADKATAETDLEAAKSHKWRSAPFRKVVSMVSNEIDYVEKMKLALEAGYCIVPNFPVDVIAIRIGNGRSPGGGSSTAGWRSSLSDFEQTTDALPAGQGEYVDRFPERRITKEDAKNNKREAITQYRAVPTEFRDPRFPVHMAKPRVLEATSRAMVLKCFDRIGVLPGRKRKADPIVVGQIIKPNKPGYEKENHNHTQITSFLIAWWIDTRDLA